MNSPVLPADVGNYGRGPGQEAPARPRTGPATRAVLGVILLLAVFGVARLMDPQTLPIRHVKVSGEFQHLSLTGLQERASKVVRGGFFNVNVETIRRVLLEEPWISEVTVKRVWPDGIDVHIREQQPVARWNDSALLNAAGDVFRPDPATIPDNIPQFRGPAGTYDSMLEFYTRLRALLPDEYRVAAITLSERRAWQIRFAGGPLVRLGRMDITRRLQRFAAHVPTQLGGRLQQMRSVDMRYTNGFAVQWKTDNKPDL
jgi:cell division protein FtsQ